MKVVKLLTDYSPSEYAFSSVDLKFFLDKEKTIVHSRIHVIHCNPLMEGGEDLNDREGATPCVWPPLVLDGGFQLKLLFLRVDGSNVTDFGRTNTHLVLPHPLDIHPRSGNSCSFLLEIGTEINPSLSTNDQGLYYSVAHDYFVTQCEPHGFSRITFYQDRPDVMACFSVGVEVDKNKYPIVLSNGNLISSTSANARREQADSDVPINATCTSVLWMDPFPKPCYLFALVAGRFAQRKETFVTKSGHHVVLSIWSPPDQVSKTEYAMCVLKSAMRWDEDVFGLEYDLDNFNIVSLPDAFMGAMENKSLNIFNSKFILASKWTTTDSDIATLSGIIAHEYFHNWTGNRVTCRDWFQLSLKEGLTDYREQEFCSDMVACPSVVRITNVLALRKEQFPEDSGPLAHAVRPNSYVEVGNLATPTVYRKGAEVVRLYQTLLGKDGFKKGMDLYIKRHDGRAATCEDLYQAMCDATDDKLPKFMAWYTQAGTPQVLVKSYYDQITRSFKIHCKQNNPSNVPMLIPLAVGLLDQHGSDIILSRVLVDGVEKLIDPMVTTLVLRLQEFEHEFVFSGIPEKPIASLLRGFSAPIQLVLGPQANREELLFLFANDSDDFSRWDAGQSLGKMLLMDLVKGSLQDGDMVMASYIDAIQHILVDASMDKEFIALAISLPTQEEVIEMMEGANPYGVYIARQALRKKIAHELKQELLRVVLDNRSQSDDVCVKLHTEEKAKRTLKNVALGYLAALGEEQMDLILYEYQHATNLTEKLAALAAISECAQPAARERLLSEFYETWKEEGEVINKWLRLQAGANLPDNVDIVRGLMYHPSVDIRNSANISALVGGFLASIINFHAADGSGYKLMADMVLQVDKFHPWQLSRLLAHALKSLHRLEKGRQALAKEQLLRIATTDGISKLVLAIVSQVLEALTC